MENLAIAPGTTVNIQLPGRIRNRRWNARLLGYLPEESLLITTPHSNGSPVPFYLDDQVAVRYLQGREIHGFTTWVRKVSADPFPYLHLAYPREVERVTVRQAERVPVELAARWRRLQGEGSGSGTLLDLSATGTLLASEETAGEPGDELELEFEIRFAGAESRIEVGALLRSVREDSRAGETRLLHGLEFTDPGERERLFLKGFVYEQLVENRNGYAAGHGGSGHDR